MIELMNRLRPRDLVALGAAFGLATNACATEEPPSVTSKSQQQVTEAPEEETPAERPSFQGEGPSRQAVAVAWQNESSKMGRNFPVRIVNNAKESYHVTLLLEGQGPGVGPTVVEFSQLVLIAGEEQSVAIELDELPVQSSVHPSSIRVVARYSPTVRSASAPALPVVEKTSSTSYTAPLLVTSTADFKNAVARTILEEKAQTDKVDIVVHMTARGETLIRDTNGAYRLPTQETTHGVLLGPQAVVSELPFEVDREKVPRVPDTETNEEEH